MRFTSTARVGNLPTQFTHPIERILLFTVAHDDDEGMLWAILSALNLNAETADTFRRVYRVACRRAQSTGTNCIIYMYLHEDGSWTISWNRQESNWDYILQTECR